MKDGHSRHTGERKSAEQKTITVLEVVFFLYLLVLMKVIVFKFPLEQLQEIAASWKKDVVLEGLNTANFVPFKTIRMYLHYYHYSYLHSFTNLFGNVLAFVPFGLLLPCVSRSCRKGRVLFLNAFVLVAGIECFQLYTAFGKFDVDDILLNCLGAIAGYFLFWNVRRIWWKRALKEAGDKRTGGEEEAQHSDSLRDLR